ncbi:MAG: NADPH-dependent oxidoreductase [Anaerolineales bacterium]|jgi:FMN reductase (NADPH)
MLNPTIDFINLHASVRHYKPDPLPNSVIETIVAAGQRASTSSNMQAYSVIAVTEAGKRGRLAGLCGNQQFIAEAPIFLVWCADLARLDHACQLRGYIQDTTYIESFLIAVVDSALAAQNAALAAESLGLGICYIGSIRNNPQEVIDMLELPHLVFPITGMTIGWPSKPPHLRPRLPLNSILHWDHYNRTHEDEALQEYDQAMIATGIYKGRQIPLPGKPSEVEDYGWTEHTARRLSRAVRTGLRAVIEKQGFGLK